MVTFPSPWTRDELTFTRWPGPVTIRYRSVVCRARTFSAREVGKLNAPVTVVWKCWRAEDPDLAEERGFPRSILEQAEHEAPVGCLLWPRMLRSAQAIDHGAS